jgi:hypothetical protein
MNPQVDWANRMEGGHVRGHNAVRAHRTRLWRRIAPRVERQRFVTDDTGNIGVDVYQMVRDRSGTIVADRMVAHVRLEEDLIRYMEIKQCGT